MFYPSFLVFTPGCLANLSLWRSLSRVPRPSVSICLISRQHMSLSPSLTCLPLPSACLSPVTYGSYSIRALCVCVLSPSLPLSLRPTWPRFLVLCLSCHLLQHNKTHSLCVINTHTHNCCTVNSSSMERGKGSNFQRMWEV